MSDDLTSLTWLSSINTARCREIQTTRAARGKVFADEQIKTLSAGADGTSGRRNLSESLLVIDLECSNKPPPTFRSMKEHNRRHRPPCSYSCLIAMALTASQTGCLPVHDIYRFIE